jgi:heat-inducible transcriptional repressor
VQEHVETAEPVGSELLAVHYDFGVRSATIRNELAELSELGYLRQPHTSAGRVPSDQGYRFYVDRLMEPPTQDTIDARRKMTAIASELEVIISETCRMLARLTSYISLATQPTMDETTVEHVALSKVGTNKLLLIVVLSDGHVEHRIIDTGGQISPADVERIGNMAHSHFIGKTIEAASAQAEPLLPDAHPVCAQVLAAVRQVAQALASEQELFVEGTNYILKHPEFKDVSRLESVLAALEERRRLYQILSRTMLGPSVTVIIGSENPYAAMRETSFVTASYRVGDRAIGTIGVVGPTRMDYRRAISAVNAMARNLSELLTLLSLS